MSFFNNDDSVLYDSQPSKGSKNSSSSKYSIDSKDSREIGDKKVNNTINFNKSRKRVFTLNSHQQTDNSANLSDIYSKENSKNVSGENIKIDNLELDYNTDIYRTPNANGINKEQINKLTSSVIPSHISKYNFSPKKKFSNLERYNANNKYLNIKKINYPDFNIIEEIRSNIIKPQYCKEEEPIVQKHTENFIDVIDQFFPQFKQTSQFNIPVSNSSNNKNSIKAKFSIFEKRLSERGKMNNSVCLDEYVKSAEKKKKSKILLNKLRKSLNISSKHSTFYKNENSNKSVIFFDQMNKLDHNNANNDDDPIKKQIPSLFSDFILLNKIPKKKNIDSTKGQNPEKRFSREWQNDSFNMNEKSEEEDSYKSQMSNIINFEIHEDFTKTRKIMNNPYVKVCREDINRNLKEFRKRQDEIKKLLLSMKEHLSSIEKFEIDIQNSFITRETLNKNLLSINNQIKTYEKKCENINYELSCISPSSRHKYNSKFDSHEKAKDNTFNSDQKSSNLSSFSSVHNPNINIQNNELNLDELIDELENKLSFVKLQSGQTREKLDIVMDDNLVKEKLNKDLVKKMKIIEKEISISQKKKITNFSNLQKTKYGEISMINNNKDMSLISNITGLADLNRDVFNNGVNTNRAKLGYINDNFYNVYDENSKKNQIYFDKHDSFGLDNSIFNHN